MAIYGYPKSLIKYNGQFTAMNYEFTVLIERDEDGFYVAEVPDLKGCYTQGKTVEEVLKNIREVIELCLEAEGGKKGLPKKMEFIGIQKVTVSA